MSNVATGLPNSVAVFNENGLLIGSADITADMLLYLVGTTPANTEVVLPNTISTIEDFDASLFPSGQIQYIMKRGTAARAGIIAFTTDGSNVNYVDTSTTEIGVTGTDFEVDIDSGRLRFRAHVDNVGAEVSVKYKISFL